MNGLLRDLLSERADAAGAPDLDLQDLIAHGEQRVTRRRRVILGSTAAAVVLMVGASFVLLQAGDRTTSPDIPPATNSPSPTTADLSPDEAADDSHPLTYGVGGTIHYGDRTIDAGEDADGLFLVDDGLAILTGENDGASETHLLFTDGGEPVEIAHGIERVTAGESGSLLVWLDRDDVVIYDTDARNVVDRLPLTDRLLSDPITPLEDAVYWHEYREDTATTEGREFLIRYDLATGTRARSSQADYEAEKRSTPPIIVEGSPDSTDPATGFEVVDGHLAAGVGVHGTGPAFLTATDERLLISVPDQYNDTTLFVFEWLDDDRFALVAESGLKRAPIGDVLVCRISAGECRTIASGEKYWLLPAPMGSVGGED